MIMILFYCKAITKSHAMLIFVYHYSIYQMTSLKVWFLRLQPTTINLS